MLTFNEEKHEYRFDGVVVPSVTQILNGSGLVDLSYISKELLAEKADLGSKVHLTTELYDIQQIDLDSLHPTLKAYLDSWIKFRQDFGFEPDEIEVECYNPIYRFAGRLDRVGLVNGKKTVVDIKSGTHQKSHAIQTAGYRLLYNYNKKGKELVKNRMCVYLTPEGYKVEEHKQQTDESVFLSALTIYNYLRGTK